MFGLENLDFLQLGGSGGSGSLLEGMDLEGFQEGNGVVTTPREQDLMKVGGKRRRNSRKQQGGKSRKRKGSKSSKRKGKKRGTKKLRKTLSKWIMHVKNFAKMNKIKYPAAMKDPRCKASFKR